MIVSLESFNAYSGNWEDSDRAKECKTMFLEAAEAVVKDYLGYDPTLHEETLELDGDLKKGIWLPARNILEIKSAQVNGHELPPDEYRLVGEKLFSSKHSQMPFISGAFKICFLAGWSNDEMPALILLSILRIATLMLTEGSGNIGLTGKSFADNSRTFVNYANYRKYLHPLDSLRIMRF